MKKNKVRWHSLQVKLRQRIYVRWKEELKVAEYDMNIYLYEPEHEVFFRRDEDEIFI